MMNLQHVDVIAPFASPLPPLPEGDVLTPSQWTTLMAIGDAVIPSLVPSSSNSVDRMSIQASEYVSTIGQIRSTAAKTATEDNIRAFLDESASSIPDLKALIHRILSDTRAGCFLITGYSASFHLQPAHVREQILQNWSQSYIPPLRGAAKGLQSLFKALWLKTSPTIGPLLGYPKVPVHGKPGKGFEYNFVQFPPAAEPAVIETDVLIIGSGCGGGVCAKNIAEDNHRVIVVEAAYHFTPQHLPMTEADAGFHLFQNGGNISSDDNSITVIAGRSWGGGGTINWSASLQTQGYVRQEWADSGLPFFTSAEFQNSLDRVCHRMGVSADHIQHNANNAILLDGACKLGYNVKPVPQNTGGKQHYCGYCTLGCRSAEKQGPVVSFLPDAANAGAQFIEGFEADRIIFEEGRGRKTAIGARGTWRSRDCNGGVSGNDRTTREVTIKAKRVIVSCGTLQSPLLLLRSGLKNPHIGQNLHLHPVGFIGAVFPTEIRPWEGGILTTVVDSFQDLDGAGHGVKLEACTMIPSMILPIFPWKSGLEWKSFVAKFGYMTCSFALARDRETGRIYPDPVTGRCRISYTPSPFDRAHILTGMEVLAKICHAAGAHEIISATSGISTFVRRHVSVDDPDPGINEPSFQSWLAALRKKGLPSPDASFASAHQMGTCRMGASDRTSVVDGSGKVWGVEGLYVADASVFPSASGVNPMVTNMAISDWISRGVSKGLKGERR